MDVVLDDRMLFARGCDAARYRLVLHAISSTACKFVKGSCLAPGEFGGCSLRRPDVKFWCKNLLEKGACATLGPFQGNHRLPKPAEFSAQARDERARGVLRRSTSQAGWARS